MKLERKDATETKTKFKEKFTYRPTHKEWEKKVTLVVTPEDAYKDLGALGLPPGIDDVIIIEFSVKEKQIKLDKEY
jgi:hypothetical protein